MRDVSDDVDKYEVVPGTEFYISRTAGADNSSYYTISGKRVQFKEVWLSKQAMEIVMQERTFI